ncbi:tetratricopeptide repeat protein [Methanocaldococcus sp. 10A]
MGPLKKFLNILISNENSYNWITDAEKYLDEENYEKAVECYLKALKTNNMRAIDWANLSYAYYHLNDYENALKAIDKALHLSSENPEFLYLRGSILYKLKNFEEAYKCFIKASKKIKKSDLYEILGELSLKFKKYDDALNYYLKAYKLNENNIDALYMAGKISLLLGDIDKSYKLFKEILEKEPNHKCKKIVDYMENIIEIINTDIYENIEIGIRMLDKGDYINALKHFNKVISTDNTNDFAYYYKSIISEIFGDYQKALKYIDKAIFILKKSIYYAKKGDILSKMDNLEAVDCYKKSLELNPNLYAYFGLAIFYYKRKDFEKASVFFDKVLESYTSDLSKKDTDVLTIYSLIGLGETTGISKYYEGILSYINNLLDRDPENSEWWKIKGYIYYKLKNYKEAHECFINALRIDSNNIDAIKSLIVLYEKSGKFDDALSMAMKLKKLLQNDEAEEIVKKLMNREPTNLEIPSPLLNVPVMYYKPNHIQYHLSTLYRYININPIGAFIYISYLETSEIITEIEDEEISKAILKLIKELKEKLPIEMYKYCESPNNYKPSEEIIEIYKRELGTLTI